MLVSTCSHECGCGREKIARTMLMTGIDTEGARAGTATKAVEPASIEEAIESIVKGEVVRCAARSVGRGVLSVARRRISSPDSNLMRA